MLYFGSDYIEGAHESILKRLMETNLEPLTGYGEDKYCDSAKEKIRKACGYPNAAVSLLVGGTQTNSTVIAALLNNYHGVIATTDGHIYAHEAGAIEHSGHKVLTLPSHNGKMDPDELAAYLEGFYKDPTYEHCVIPGMVYISHPTEFGTLYTKAELQALDRICETYEIPLFLDGARLGYGLMSNQTDVTLKDIADTCDVFYIGGTKVGALCGEAIVFPNGKLPKHFTTTIKQQGALLAKGRVLGIQFDTLFTDDLYFKISKHAIDMAEKLKDIFAQKGYRFYIDSPTNQQFVILENKKYEELCKEVSMSHWCKYDDNHTVARFCTSWATTPEKIDALAKLL